MSFILPSDCIRCYFDSNTKDESDSVSTKIEVFFAETESLDPWFSYFNYNISNAEQLKANNFYSDTDRRTYISCHALLRLILASRLNLNPLDLSFIRKNDNKPGLSDNSAFFNVSHTREAFAIAFVRDFHVGIDLEKIKQDINFHPIIKNYFSKKEQEFVLDSKEEAINKFFLLWTRKEALLKALGFGIVSNLNQMNVSEPINLIKKESFDFLDNDLVLNQFYIYSFRLINYFLSVAIPYKSSMTFYNLNKDNFSTFLIKSCQ